MIYSRDDLDQLLLHLYKEKGSDLHLQVREYPIARISGNLTKLMNFEKITEHDMEIAANVSYRSEVASSTAMSLQDLDFAYEPSADSPFSHPARYRVNCSQDRKGLRMVFRRLPSDPPRPSEVALPDNCSRLVNSLEKGLVLVTGPTGSGKSTSLSAWIRMILENNEDGGSKHILTLEDPVEFVYDNVDKGASIITQREKSITLSDFKTGLHSALRQDPDIILVGEMRDPETIALALEAAETGHLVFGTLHTSSVAGTISRIVSVFPYQEQENVRAQLIASLRLIICQMLYPKKGGGRVASREHLIFQPEDRDELLKLNSAAEVTTGLKCLVENKGISMEQDVLNLLRNDMITNEQFDDIMQKLQSTMRSHLL